MSSSGCSSSSGTIHVIDGLTKEIYLTVPSGTKVNPGDTYILIHTEQTTGSMDAMAGHGGHGGHAGHGSGDEPRTIHHEIGRVQVVRVVDETHAEVKVLSGEAPEGVKAEKDN